MLTIHETILEMVADVRRYADAIAAKDRDLARQLRRASLSVLLNEAEGSGGRAGTRRRATTMPSARHGKPSRPLDSRCLPA